jgi:hypothetical protein
MFLEGESPFPLKGGSLWLHHYACIFFVDIDFFQNIESNKLLKS